MWRTAAPRGLGVSELTQKHVRANKVFPFHLSPFDSVAGALLLALLARGRTVRARACLSFPCNRRQWIREYVLPFVFFSRSRTRTRSTPRQQELWAQREGFLGGGWLSRCRFSFGSAAPLPTRTQALPKTGMAPSVLIVAGGVLIGAFAKGMQPRAKVQVPTSGEGRKGHYHIAAGTSGLVGTTEVCPRSHYSIIGGKRGARIPSGCLWTCRPPPSYYLMVLASRNRSRIHGPCPRPRSNSCNGGFLGAPRPFPSHQ